jgi:hypothetical protein
MTPVQDPPELLRRMHAPPVLRAVDPDGPGLPPDTAVEKVTLPNPRKGWRGAPLAEISLARDAGGLWMWGWGWQTAEAGSFTGIGPKWGRFAETRADALFWGAQDLVAAMEKHLRWLGTRNAADAALARKIIAWAAGLG